MKRILLTILVLGALASYAFAQAPPPSPGCPIPENYCPAVHQGTTTAFCGYEQCKKGVTSEASGIKVEAPSGEGFPMVWFVSSTGKLKAGNFTFKCELVEQKDRTLVRIPRVVNIPATANAPAKTVKDNIKCGVDLDIGDGQVYHEHFVSNPEKQCLGWVECQQPAPAPAK